MEKRGTRQEVSRQRPGLATTQVGPKRAGFFPSANEMTQPARRLILINELSLAINQLSERQAMMQAAVDGLARVLDLDQCGLALFNEKQDSLTVVAERLAAGSVSAIGLQIPLATPSIQHILETKTAVVVTDAQNDPLLADVHEMIAQRQVASILIVPLLVRDEVIGTIGCNAISTPHPFSAEEVTLAETVANLVAARIENTRLYEAERRRRQESETLREATAALASSLNLKELLDEILIRLNQVVPYDSTSIYLREGNCLRAMAARGTAAVEQTVGELYPADDPVSRELAQARQPICIADITADIRFEDWANTGYIRGWMGVPLVVREQFIGYLTLDSRTIAMYTEAEANLAQAFARQAAVAVENARLFRQVQEQAANLEEEVMARTAELVAANEQLQRRLNYEKEIDRREKLAYELGRQLSSLLDPQQLLAETAYRLSDAFGYYHVHIYLLKSPNSTQISDQSASSLLFLAEGTGDPAQQLKQRQYTIPLAAPHSLVAQAGRSLEPVVVNDVSQEARYRPNPVLPATRSEAAIPLFAGPRLIGVLNIQHHAAGHFDAQEIRLLQIVAGQLSVALANARLFAENARQLAMIEQSAELIALGSHDGRVLYTNQAGLQMTGYQKLADIVGQPIASFYAPEDLARLEQEIMPAVLAQGTWRGENRLKRADGSLLPIEQTIFTIHQEPSTPALLATMMTDITGRKVAETERENLLAAEQRRAEELAALVAAAAAVSASLEIGEVLQVVAEQMANLLHVEACAISSWNTAANFVRLLTQYTDINADWQSEPAWYAPYDLNDYPATRAVLEEGIPAQFRLDDPNIDPGERRFMENSYVRSLLMLPLVIQDRTIGLAELIDRHTFRTFTSQEIGLVQTLANQAAVAIHNAQVFAAERRRSAELEALRQASLSLTSSLELTQVLEAILEHSLRLIAADNAHLFLYDGQKLAFGAGLWAGQTQSVPIAEPRQEGVTYLVAHSGQRIIIPDVNSHPLYTTWKWGGALVALPLQISGEVRGVMNVAFGRPHHFDDNELRALELLADQAALALENARLFEFTRRQVKELTVLHAVAMAGAEATGEDALIERVTEIIGENLFPDNFGVLLLDENGRFLHVHPSYRINQEFAPSPIPLGRGITGEVAQTGYSHRTDDISQDSQYFRADSQTRSEVCVPLKLRDQVIGVINAESSQTQAFTEADELLLTTLAGQLATAIEKVRLLAAERRQLKELTALHGVALASTAATDEDILIETATAIVGEALYPDNFGVLLLNEENGSLVTHPSYRGQIVTLAKEQGITGLVARTGRPERLNDVSQSSHFLNIDPESRSELCVPLKTGERVIGVINAESNRLNAFSEADERFLTTFASQLATAIARTRLFNETQQRAEELAVALARQEELDRLKSEFIQNVSHELRTPLAIIHGYAELMGSGEFGLLLPDQIEPVNIIVRRVYMLTKLVDDFTAILSAEAQALRREPVDLEPVVKMMLADFIVSAKKSGVHLLAEVEPSPPVYGDPGQLRRIFDNLIGNALKFTPAGGHILIRLRPEQANVLVEVIDTGIGIPTTQVSRVFERFYQVDGSMTRRYGGTGLGLALVKEIVEAHGGTVQLESSLGHGSKFSIRLPKYE